MNHNRTARLAARALKDRWLTDAAPVSVLRRAGARDIHGEWTEGAAVTVGTYRAVTEPDSAGDERLLEPEGLRTEARRRFFLPSAVRVRAVSATSAGDELEWNGRTYRAESVERWRGAFSVVVGVTSETRGAIPGVVQRPTP